MRTLEQIKFKLLAYSGADLIYTDRGYVAWQVSTGENLEILFIETAHHGIGYGHALMKEFCERVRPKPYHSVFAFRLAKNHQAGQFYRSLGFSETLIPKLYKGDDAVLSVVPFNVLCDYTGVV